MLYALELILKDHGYEVETAMTPEAGINKVLAAKPDLVILDVIMPSGYEGFEVARAIREEHDLVDLPVVMLSNVHPRPDGPGALDFGQCGRSGATSRSRSAFAGASPVADSFAPITEQRVEQVPHLG